MGESQPYTVGVVEGIKVVGSLVGIELIGILVGTEVGMGEGR